MADQDDAAETPPSPNGVAPAALGRAARGAGALRALGWALIVTLVATPTYGRVAWELSAELEQAAAAESVGERITHLGRAARWKLPFARGDEAALDELMHLGRTRAAQAEDDVESRLIALAAYREARAAILARRGPIQWSSERERLHELDVEIAALMALEEQRWYGPVHAKDAAWHLERLEVASARARPYAFAAALAFLAALAGFVLFLLRGVGDDGRVRRPWGWLWLSITISGTAAWLLLLGRDAPADGPRGQPSAQASAQATDAAAASGETDSPATPSVKTTGTPPATAPSAR
jgi:hypothetical protein